MGRNTTAGAARQKFVEMFGREKRWLKIAEIAKAVGMPAVSCKYHLTALEEQGQVKSRGKTSARRYAHVSVADEALDAIAKPAGTPLEKQKRKPALRRKTARAKLQRAARRPRRSKAPITLPASLPAPRPVETVPANDGFVCAINDAGAIGITKGAERIALDPQEIRTLLRFLDNKAA